jgi:hypothetical protein
VTGFKDEKEMWKYQTPRLLGSKWARYELIMPDGHPDVKGSYKGRIRYIENKVAEMPDYSLLRPSQREYVQWLLDCKQEVWLAFGSPSEKRILFVQGPMFGVIKRPPFWRP